MADIRQKIKKLGELKAILEKARERGEKIVFTNGCFDLLHLGHTRYLQKAKELGDILLVAVNSDSSLQQIKGDKRPINPQDERAEVLASLGCVDYVVIFDEPDPLKVITRLRPDILVKGGDWEKDEIIGGKEVESWGGMVCTIPVVWRISTTRIIERIINRYRK